MGGHGEITLTKAKLKALELKEAKPENIIRRKTFEDIYKLLLQEKKDELEKEVISQKTYDTYVRNKKRITTLLKMGIDQVTTMDIKQCLNECKNKPSLCNKVLSLIQQVFSLAYSLRLIEFDPTYRLSPKKDAGGAENIKTRSLSVEEIEIAFDYLGRYASRKVYLCCALLLVFGCRKNELIRAKKSAFDLEKGIWTTKQKKHKKRINEREIKGQPAEVPMEPEVVAMVKEMMALSKRSDYLVSATRMPFTTPISTATINNTLDRMFEMSDIPIDRFHPHDLRRTTVSVMRDVLDIDHDVVEKMQGHSLGKVQQHYKRELLDQRRVAQRKLLDLIGVYILD
nr:tyrosine-type recombinase/integrase [Endozoicomonas atrinae]